MITKTGIGRCSCLTVKDFSVGDRVRIVHSDPSWGICKVGSIGTVKQIRATDLIVDMDVVGDRFFESFLNYKGIVLKPQRLTKIKSK